MHNQTLKNSLTDLEVFTVSGLGLCGMKNGKLLDYCSKNDFDIILTIDKNLMHQQILDHFPVTIVVLNSPTSKFENLIEFLPSFKSQLKTFKKHEAYLIDK